MSPNATLTPLKSSSFKPDPLLEGTFSEQRTPQPEASAVIAPTTFANDCHDDQGRFCDVPGHDHSDGENHPSDVRWWHGTPSGDLRGGAYGLHIGTKQAALEALNARIGTPVEGEWDGTRVYGETLLKGYQSTGYNAGPSHNDAYPTGAATFSDGTQVPLTAKPNIIGVSIKGAMSNTTDNPMSDTRANGQMRGQITKGNAKRGYYYTNEGEDSGSISAVVPNGSHLNVVYDKSRSTRASAEFNNDCHDPDTGEFCPTNGGSSAADEAEASQDPYRGQHQPPRDSATIDDLANSTIGTFPDDVYDHPEFYDHTGQESKADRESAAVIKKVRDNPDAPVTVYRAAPPGVKKINKGDWVAVSEAYAREHAEAQAPEGEPPWPVYSAEVPAKFIHSGGNDIVEYGMWHDDLPAKVVPKKG